MRKKMKEKKGMAARNRALDKAIKEEMRSEHTFDH